MSSGRKAAGIENKSLKDRAIIIWFTDTDKIHGRGFIHRHFVVNSSVRAGRVANSANVLMKVRHLGAVHLLLSWCDRPFVFARILFLGFFCHEVAWKIIISQKERGESK